VKIWELGRGKKKKEEKKWRGEVKLRVEILISA
jgi:hypothetical protein